MRVPRPGRHRLPIWPRGVEILLLALASLALTGLALATMARAAECPSIVWQDEFDGSSLDTSKWQPMVGDGCDHGICGRGNDELQHYRTANATVSNGVLRIEAREENAAGRVHTSARLRTKGLGDFQFGRMEARIKLTQGQGIWPAFWMLPTDEVHGGWPRSGEIDIMENVGHEPATVHGTLHFGPAFPDNQHLGASYELQDGAFADDFHIFAVEREPGEIRWYVDDILYSTKTRADTAPHAWPFDERFHFLLNVAVGGTWPGDPDETTVFPQVMEVDYVRVYDGNLPTIRGDRVVSNGESGVTYTVVNATGASAYRWSVPDGARIASGQGTSQIRVDWGETGGDVAVEVTDVCGSRQVAVDVYVEPSYVPNVVF